MSWSIWGLKIDDPTAIDMESKFRADVEASMSAQGAQFESDETKEQVEAAVALVLTAVRSHAKALGGAALGVSMNGHSNPGHQKREGFANDCLSISVCAA